MQCLGNRDRHRQRWCNLTCNSNQADCHINAGTVVVPALNKWTCTTPEGCATGPSKIMCLPSPTDNCSSGTAQWYCTGTERLAMQPASTARRCQSQTSFNMCWCGPKAVSVTAVQCNWWVGRNNARMCKWAPSTAVCGFGDTILAAEGMCHLSIVVCVHTLHCVCSGQRSASRAGLVGKACSIQAIMPHTNVSVETCMKNPRRTVMPKCRQQHAH
jgi:hypothetical protein